MAAPGYTQYFAVEATGHRIGLMSCLKCGATILLADEPDAARIHDEWHREMGKKEGWPSRPG